MIGERTCHFSTRTGDIPGSNTKTLLITEHTRTAILLGGLTGRTWTQGSTLALMTDMSVTARHVCAHTYLRYGNFLTLEVNTSLSVTALGTIRTRRIYRNQTGKCGAQNRGALSFGTEQTVSAVRDARCTDRCRETESVLNASLTGSTISIRVTRCSDGLL